MRRLSELFLESDWEPTKLPEYDANEGSNPFATFAEIPARSRYQYLLDDAQYFVMTFIRGPVCRGQVAVSVIEDHFFVAFLDPDSDLSVVNDEFFEQTTDLLSLPGENESDFASRSPLAQIQSRPTPLPGSPQEILQPAGSRRPRPLARLPLGWRRTQPQRATHGISAFR